MDQSEEILKALDDAENTVATLRALIEAEAVSPTASSNDAGPTSMFSKDHIHYTKYMALSTVKLFEQQGMEVFRIPDSVGLYFIVPNTQVRTAARSAVLRVVKLSDDYLDDYHPPAFVQVGDWVYPLMAGSLAYRSEEKYYLFPDLLSSIPNSSVGVVLPMSCPPETREQFERLLLSLLEMDSFPPVTPVAFGKSTELILTARTSVDLVRTESGVYSQQRTSQMNNLRGNQHNEQQQGYGKRIGNGIRAVGELTSRGFEIGAVGTANALSLGTNYLKAVLPRGEADREIPDLVVGGVLCAKDLTGRVVSISSTIWTTLRRMTANLADFSACYLKSAAAPAMNAVIEGSGINRETFDAVTSELQDVGEGFLCASLEAYAGLEIAAVMLAKSISSNSGQIVTHCYGPSAATVLEDAGTVFGNVALVAVHGNQITNVGKRANRIVKRVGVSLALDECDNTSA